jgi:hypothetical protein
MKDEEPALELIATTLRIMAPRRARNLADRRFQSLA